MNIDMKLNKFVERQVKKNLTATDLQSEGVQKFIQAVSESYNEFERDSQLLNQAFSVSEQEYIEMNEKFKHEVNIRYISIAKLTETIESMNLGKIFNSGNSDLTGVIDFLKHELEEKKKADELLLQSQKRLQLALKTVGDNVWEYDFELRKMTFAHSGKKIFSSNGVCW
jgi:two-component system, sensor histidine kinase